MVDRIRNVRRPPIDASLAEQLAAHKGRWVAIDTATPAPRIVAVGDSAPEVLTGAQAESVMDPILFQVPVHPEWLSFRRSCTDAVV